MNLLFSLAFLLFQNGPFVQFTYCHEMLRGEYELQCVELTPAGKGTVRFKRRGADSIKVDVSLSNLARDRFLTFVSATNNLQDAETYESQRKVADLGKKHFTLET